MMSEFDLIRRYFTRATPSADLGIGDDCALLTVTPGHQLAVSTDMLVSGRHFFADVDAYRLGHKALAVNLSDMAAMGARPRWFTLSLSLPAVQPDWLERFAAGLFALAEQHAVELVGGDTTAGPLNLCLQIMGEVPRGQALTRAGARAGDDVWLSGAVGGAALALAALQGRVAMQSEPLIQCRARLEVPAPRVALGLALRGVASAAIDVSDGLLADLGHVLAGSGVGARLQWPSVPRAPALEALDDAHLARRCALAGGDDYELCFTAPPSQRERIAEISAQLALPLSRIGAVTGEPGLVVTDAQGVAMQLDHRGFDHFA